MNGAPRACSAFFGWSIATFLGPTTPAPCWSPVNREIIGWLEFLGGGYFIVQVQDVQGARAEQGGARAGVAAVPRRACQALVRQRAPIPAALLPRHLHSTAPLPQPASPRGGPSSLSRWRCFSVGDLEEARARVPSRRESTSREGVITRADNRAGEEQGWAGANWARPISVEGIR